MGERTRVEIAPEAMVGGEYDFRAEEHLADRFAKRSKEIYDSMIIGEDSAKEMMATILLTGASNGMGGITLGPPGTAKSMMNEQGFTVVEGIEPHRAKAIPHKQDLTATELVGKTNEMTRSYTKDGKTEEESITAHVVPIIGEGIQGLRADEVTRTSPYALNAIFKILSDGTVEYFDENGEPQKAELEFFISSMNNYGTAFTNRLDPALVNRHAMGVFMGERPRGGLSEASQTMWDDHEKIYRSEPAKETAINLEELHQIRRVIPLVTMKKPAIEYGMKLQAQALDYLQDKGVNQGDGRHTSQIIRVAKSLTLLRNEREVTEEVLRDTLSYSMIARLGMTGKITTNAEAEKIVASFN